MNHKIEVLAVVLMAMVSSTPAADKNTTGTITQMVAGDMACYVDFVDEQGQPFSEMADFEICERVDLIGQQVHITYEQANVIAAACEGNPECPDSETVLLVVDMRPVAGNTGP